MSRHAPALRRLSGEPEPAMVLDVFSRRLVGWMMSDTLRTELVLAALEMAVHHRDTGPCAVAATDDTTDSDCVIHHSDHGCQYTSYAFSRCLGRVS